MVLNATFNIIPVVSWRSVLLVDDTGVPEKTTDLPQVIVGGIRCPDEHY
jgi:hypothetical protein